jgi:hypothetical protein
MTGIVLAHDAPGQPSLRYVLGTLLSRATHADIAVAHLRLFAVDLSDAERADLARCRLLLGRLDAAGLDEFGMTRDGAAPRLDAFLHLLDTGHVEVRSGGTLAWVPDFSVFRGLPRTPKTPDGAVCLIGAHYFSRPLPGTGEALTGLVSAPASVRLASQRFAALWKRAHDVGEAVRSAIRSA